MYDVPAVLTGVGVDVVLQGGQRLESPLADRTLVRTLLWERKAVLGV